MELHFRERLIRNIFQVLLYHSTTQGYQRTGWACLQPPQPLLFEFSALRLRNETANLIDGNCKAVCRKKRRSVLANLAASRVAIQ